MRSKLRFLAALLFGTAFFVTARADNFVTRYQAVVNSKGKTTEAARLHELFKVDWAYTIDVNPELATYLGVPGYDMKWTDLSPAAIAERRVLTGRALTVLATIDRAQLLPTDQVNYDLFKRQAEEALEGARFPTEYYQLTQLNGIQQDAAQIFSMMPKQSVAQLENQLARLQALPAVVDQVIALLEEGLKRGVTPPQITLRDVPQQVRNQIPEEAFKSPLLLGFNDLPATLPGEQGTKLRADAAKAYTEKVRPAFQRLEAFITTEYLPGARQTIAATTLPDGAAFYAWRIKTQTSTDLTAQQIHDLGLAEVMRIRAEMDKIKTQTGFKGTMPEFFTYLQTDPKFFFTDKEDLMRAYRDIAKRADPQLMKLFKTLPRTPYGVIPVPAYAEKSQTTAYYNPGATDTGRPGYFYANTYALNTRPKWEMQPLTLHEAVPGHHLQISLAQEMGDLPDFRRYGGYTAFVEGWGLYSESLGDEMGFYTDPYDKFGQLTYEIWRAVRLVTDTGMHSLGWSRQQAIDYFKANSSKSEHDIVVEIDRYIVWPGQALAYKLGELKLKELRAYATQELGKKFDVRLFHDEVLRNGAVPLSMLESQIKAWVAAQKKG
ncbi:MAG: DUF885 domain-containing protein [Lacunisphaera sp.]|nr:DUF885 domain-containing protein [Lacunisphaera sp.]